MECKTCRWFVRMIDGVTIGTCHFNPPDSKGFPRVDDWSFCSRHNDDIVGDPLRGITFESRPEE